jgi:signal recognition particle GTPase
LKTKFETLEAEKAEADEKAASKSGNVDEVKKQLEAKHKKEMDAVTGENATLKSQLETHVIGEGLTQALVKAKIAPQHMDAVKALIKSNFKGEVGDNDGKPFAKFDGKAVEEFVTGWAQTDVGKHYVAADNNSGGGSNGANGSGKAGNDGKKTMTRKDFENLSPADKMKTSREGVSLTD